MKDTIQVHCGKCSEQTWTQSLWRHFHVYKDLMPPTNVLVLNPPTKLWLVLCPFSKVKSHQRAPDRVEPMKNISRVGSDSEVWKQALLQVEVYNHSMHGVRRGVHPGRVTSVSQDIQTKNFRVCGSPELQSPHRTNPHSHWPAAPS